MLTISRMFFSKHIMFQLVLVKYYHYINNCRFSRTYTGPQGRRLIIQTLSQGSKNLKKR